MRRVAGSPYADGALSKHERRRVDVRQHAGSHASTCTCAHLHVHVHASTWTSACEHQLSSSLVERHLGSPNQPGEGRGVMIRGRGYDHVPLGALPQSAASSEPPPLAAWKGFGGAAKGWGAAAVALGSRVGVAVEGGAGA